MLVKGPVKRDKACIFDSERIYNDHIFVAGILTKCYELFNYIKSQRSKFL